MSAQLPTPETDAKASDFVLAEFARRLERERDSAKQLNRELLDKLEAMQAERIVACVNACRGMADPAKEIAAIIRLRWIPVSERMPTEEDANDSHDVEWSNSGDIWQAHFTDSERATHWRPITLP